jgi:hypothetical protein
MQENEFKPTATTTTKRGRKPKRSEGLGDTIEKITTATGIKAAVDWFSEATGVDCGCDARKEKLNKIFRYRKPECLTQTEYEYIGKMKGRNVVTAFEQVELNKIYNRVFNDKVQPTSCGSCMRGRLQELEALYNAYGQ